MRRALLVMTVALGLTFGSALPTSAAIEIPVQIDCDDGDSFGLTVDSDTLTALTSSIEAINNTPTGLTCTLTQVSVPLPVVTFGGVAAAAQSSGYVIGAGSVLVGCREDPSQEFIGNFSVKMYTRDGAVRGSANLSVASGQCMPAGTLRSKPTCLTILPTTLGGGRAWANSVVTSGSGALFAPQVGHTIGWAFEDNGPKGGTLMKDRFKVNEFPGSCPLPGDPNKDFYNLVSGDITVKP